MIRQTIFIFLETNKRIFWNLRITFGFWASTRFEAFSASIGNISAETRDSKKFKIFLWISCWMQSLNTSTSFPDDYCNRYHCFCNNSSFDTFAIKSNTTITVTRGLHVATTSWTVLWVIWSFVWNLFTLNDFKQKNFKVKIFNMKDINGNNN